MTKQPSRDVIQVTVSDTHSGSNHALFLPNEWHGRNNSHIPRSEQIQIRAQFELFADEVKAARKGKQIKLIHNGDAIDGDHHHSGDVCSINLLDQADIHIDIMEELKQRIDWQAGDELYYTRGTQSHTNELENYIGDRTNAIPCGEYYVHDLLKLKTNGAVSWYVHHGPSAGKGANEGNPMRNWLKNIYYDALKDNTEIPDIVHTAHVHTPDYQPIGIRLNGYVYKIMHGIISPSWQKKTRYAHMVAPVQRNRIGGVYQEIKSDGTICIPKFCVMDGE